MFEVPESDIIRVRVSKDVILGKKPIEFIRSTETSKNSAAAAAATTDSNESIEVENELKSKAKTYA
jgi:hypothetical protein